jgi:hypothetical protein
LIKSIPGDFISTSLALLVTAFMPLNWHFISRQPTIRSRTQRTKTSRKKIP